MITLDDFKGKVYRWLPKKGVTYHTEMANERPIEDVHYSPVYEIPRQSEFNTRPARMPIFTSFNRRGYRAVMRDEFLYKSELVAMAASTPAGIATHVPWHERTNISRPPAVAYGNMTIMEPHDPYLTLRPYVGNSQDLGY